MSFGIANNVRSEVRACTPDLLRQALDSPTVAQVCADIEDALEQVRRGEMQAEEFKELKARLKSRLPVLTPHATFANGRRKNEDAVPSGLCMYDKDHIQHAREWAEETCARLSQMGLMEQILLMHITPSGEGCRIIFVKPQDMTLDEAQAWMAQVLGDADYDESVKDMARCSYLVPRNYVVYMDEVGLFEERTLDQQTLPQQTLPQQTLPLTPPKGGEYIQPTDETPSQDANHSTPLPWEGQGGVSRSGSGSSTFKGLPYSSIIAEWFKRNGGEPQQGERNTKLHRLASHLRYITDNNESLLLDIMPSYGLRPDEMKSIVHNACIARFYGMPRSLKQMLDDMLRLPMESAEEDTEEDASQPPRMPRVLPPLIRLLVSRTPKIYRPAVAHAVFPALASHLWQTRFRYIDNVEHEATLMNVLMAGTGAGKNCISEPINRIMADIRRKDAENLRREREWKKEMQTKGANKDKRQRPEGLVIQEIDPDMTNAAFVQRLADAEERFLYTRMNEIDQFDALKTSARSKAHFQIMCLSFDPGNVYGQTRVGTTSVSERVCIRFNWNACTTVQKGKEYFRNVLTDGPVSRINFCTIPEREIGAEMPIYGTYGEDFDEELRPYIERLSSARGQVECAKARTLAKKLMEECAEFSRLSQSRVYENLSFRANVIAFLKAMVLYVAQGEKWDKVTEDFIRWSLRYDLWCKMQFFGESIETQADSQAKRHKGPQNLLDLLPDTFTKEEAYEVCRRMAVKTDAVQMLRVWKSREYIEMIEDDPTPQDARYMRYRKTEKYKDRGKR